MPERERITLIWERLGPYHAARLAATAAIAEVTVLEMASRDAIYAWERVDALGDARRITVLPGRSIHDVPPVEGALALRAALEDASPSVVAIPSWGFWYSLVALDWCRRRGIPVVVMSDSNPHDKPRRWLQEWIKSLIVAQCGAALVSRPEYLLALGMPRGRIHLGYNAIDNAHFQTAGGGPLAERRRFLFLGRFVAKKNLPSLLEAYGAYAAASADPWELHLVGDGPLRPALEAQAAGLGPRARVTFTGFVQYGDLPAIYATAALLVLPSTEEQWGNVVNEAMAAGVPVAASTACGSTALIDHGTNGLLFEPRDTAAITALLEDASSGKVDLARLALAGRETIALWGPGHFASSLVQACRTALGARLSAYNFMTRALVARLARRPLDPDAA